MINFFTFDGVSSRDYGVYISGHDTFNSPARAYNFIYVSGKDGDDIGIEKRLQNVTLIYDAFIYRAFGKNTEGLRNLLLSKFGYKRLVDTYHPDEFRLAAFDSSLDFSTTSNNKAGSFQIAFNCKPQRYLFSGTQAKVFTEDGTIDNPSLFASKPLIRVYGTGSVGIGNKTITITSANEYTDIDCEIMEAFKGVVNCNGNVEYSGSDFPTLPYGTSNIVLSGNVTRVEITPRWFIV